MKKTEQRWMRESNGYVAEREFTPNPMTIKEFKQWWNRFEYSGNFPEPKAEHINLLLAEITRLTAELKEREGEVGRIRKTYDSQMDILRKRVESLLLDKEFLTSNVNHAESLAATRLADQEAIERHTRKQIYRELYEIRYETDKLLCKIERECAPYIQQKYGVP